MRTNRRHSRPQTNEHWRSRGSLSRLSVRIEGCQPRTSHLLDSECASASFTGAALTVIYTANTNCPSHWKQGRLCIQYADGTRIIVL